MTEPGLTHRERFANAGDTGAARAGGAPFVPLLLAGLGAYFLWFGVHYWRDTVTRWPSDPVKAVLQGKGLPAVHRAPSIASEVTATGIAGAGTPAQVGPGSITGQDIAAAALKYKGHCYLYGGAPGRDGKSCWDCSSCDNWIIGHDLKMSIPSFDHGAYDGTQHGPATGQWLLWTGARTIARKDCAAGDLCIWQTHMGIALDGRQMLSAADPAQGTIVSAIDTGGPPGEVLVVRRLRETLAGGGGNTTAAQNQNTARLLTAGHGWAPSQDAGQWEALVHLWDTESGWDEKAQNPSSGAYGIPQSLPGSKMAKFGGNWRTSARTQIRWGLWYIRTRYGSPQAAWAHEQAMGWY